MAFKRPPEKGALSYYILNVIVYNPGSGHREICDAVGQRTRTRDFIDLIIRGYIRAIGSIEKCVYYPTNDGVLVILKQEWKDQLPVGLIKNVSTPGKKSLVGGTRIYNTLNEVVRHPGSMCWQVSEAVGLTSATRYLHCLEAGGFVRKEGNRSEYRYFPTNAGIFEVFQQIRSDQVVIKCAEQSDYGGPSKRQPCKE